MKTAIHVVANAAAVASLSVAAGSASHSKALVSHSNRPLTHNKAYNARISLSQRASRSENRWLATTTTTTTTSAPSAKAQEKLRNKTTGHSSTPGLVPPVTDLDRSRIRACIIENESHGDPLAHNAHSSAAGIGQWVTGTWNNWGGYATADLAPMDVQQQRMDYDMSLPMAHIQAEWAAQRKVCGF